MNGARGVEKPDKDVGEEGRQAPARVERRRPRSTRRAPTSTPPPPSAISPMPRSASTTPPAEVDTLAQEQPLKGHLLAAELGSRRRPSRRCATSSGCARTRSGTSTRTRRRTTTRPRAPRPKPPRRLPRGRRRSTTSRTSSRRATSSPGIRDTLDSELADPRRRHHPRGDRTTSPPAAAGQRHAAAARRFPNETDRRRAARTGRSSATGRWWQSTHRRPGAAERADSPDPRRREDCRRTSAVSREPTGRPASGWPPTARQAARGPRRSCAERANAAPDEPAMQGSSREVDVLRERLRALRRRSTGPHRAPARQPVLVPRSPRSPRRSAPARAPGRPAARTALDAVLEGLADGEAELEPVAGTPTPIRGRGPRPRRCTARRRDLRDRVADRRAGSNVDARERRPQGADPAPGQGHARDLRGARLATPTYQGVPRARRPQRRRPLARESHRTVLTGASLVGASLTAPT